MKKHLFFVFLLLLLSILCTLVSCESKTQAEQRETEAVTEEPETEPITYELPVPTPPISASVYCLSYRVCGEQRNLCSTFINKKMVLFLPESLDRHHLVMYCPYASGYEVFFNDENVTDRIFEWDVYDTPEATYTVRQKGKNVASYPIEIEYLPGPIVSLDVDESRGKLSFLLGGTKKTFLCYGVCSVDSVEDDTQDFISYYNMNAHGNATLGNPKKALNVRFYENGACEEKAKYSIFGMDYRSNWTFLATHNDYTLLRTAFAFDMAKKLGLRGTLNYRFAQVYLNGQYNGFYIITEKPQDVLKGLGLKEADSDTLELSYALELDNHADTSSPYFFRSDKGRNITVHTEIEGCLYTKLKDFINSAERAMRSKDGIDPQTGKRLDELIDIESFAKAMIVREFCYDYDVVSSLWFYYDGNEHKLFAGPVWDFDNSLGRHDMTPIMLDTTICAMADTSRGGGFWLRVLYENPVFRAELDKIVKQYSDLFDADNENGLTELWHGYYAQTVDMILPNFVRWPSVLKDPPKTELFPYNTYDGTKYGTYFGWVGEFIYERCIYTPKNLSQQTQ